MTPHGDRVGEPASRADDLRFVLGDASTRWIRVARGSMPPDVPADVGGLVVGGGRPRHLGPELARWAWRDLLVRSGGAGPRVVVPIGRPAVARYVFGTWSHPPQRARRLRNRAVAFAVGRGLVPPRVRAAVASRRPGAPYLLGAAGAFGVPPDADWFLALGDGDALQRGTFHVFPRGASMPRWVVKFARVPGDDTTFRREADAYELLARRAPAAARRAPERLGRCDVDVPAVVETAAPGPGLHAVLDADGARRPKLARIAEVVAWLGALGDESRGPVADLAVERDRLARDVLPQFPGVAADLATVAPGMRPVLAHHDAGSWNMVAGPQGVTVLDWESARYPAMPVWDVLYFLTDALVALHGPASDDVKVGRALALLRGELPESEDLFRRLRDAAARADLSVDDLPAVATLAWLHHGTSAARRRARAEDVGRDDEIGVGLLTRIAAPWLSDPALGPRWPAFPR